jgi:hypothetical protein
VEESDKVRMNSRSRTKSGTRALERVDMWSTRMRRPIRRALKHGRSMQTCESDNHRMGPGDLAAAQAPKKERSGERRGIRVRVTLITCWKGGRD